MGCVLIHWESQNCQFGPLAWGYPQQPRLTPVCQGRQWAAGSGQGGAFCPLQSLRFSLSLSRIQLNRFVIARRPRGAFLVATQEFNVLKLRRVNSVCKNTKERRKQIEFFKTPIYTHTFFSFQEALKLPSRPTYDFPPSASLCCASIRVHSSWGEKGAVGEQQIALGTKPMRCEDVASSLAPES